MSRGQIVVVPDAAALADEVSARIERAANETPPDSRFRIALSGGHTPRPTYERLAEREPPWSRFEIYFGDERLVPADDPASNFHMARDALISRAPLSDDQVHRIPGELGPDDAAAAAAADLGGSASSPPRLDMILLGMGPDGHTASLFPGAPELDVADRTTVPVHRPEMPQPWRVSMTYPVINAADRVVFLVSGADKAEPLARAVSGDRALPSGRVDPAQGELVWVVTEDAARLL